MGVDSNMRDQLVCKVEVGENAEKADWKGRGFLGQVKTCCKGTPTNLKALIQLRLLAVAEM